MGSADRRRALIPPATVVRGEARRGPLALPAAALVTALVALAPAGAPAQTQLPPSFEDQIVKGELFFPVGMSFLPDGRLVVIERAGSLRLVVEGKLGAVDPFGIVDSVRTETPGAGLLGVAVDRAWPARPYVYCLYDAADSTLRISRFEAVGNLADGTSVDLALDPASRYDVLRGIPDTTGTNACGALRFGADGRLYVSIGDGGHPCAALDTASTRGAILRLDVSTLPDGPGGPPDPGLITPPDNPFVTHADPAARLVWALGLRDPFRFHLDGNALYVGDVGETSWEEIDRLTGGGASCGWPAREGLVANPNSCALDSAAVHVAPIHVYGDRSPGGEAAVIGGGVYRTGSCMACNFPPAYVGSYFFSDYYSGFLRRLVPDGGGWRLADPVPGQPSATDWGRGFEGVSDYLTGPDGALWYCRNGDGGPNGEVHRIVHLNMISDAATRPEDGIRLLAPFPSPASGTVRFRYTLARPATVELELLDLAGRRVARLIDHAVREPGSHTVEWSGRRDDGRDAAPGMYRVRLRAGAVALERRLAWIR